MGRGKFYLIILIIFGALFGWSSIPIINGNAGWGGIFIVYFWFLLAGLYIIISLIYEATHKVVTPREEMTYHYLNQIFLYISKIYILVTLAIFLFYYFKYDVNSESMLVVGGVILLSLLTIFIFWVQKKSIVYKKTYHRFLMVITVPALAAFIMSGPMFFIFGFEDTKENFYDQKATTAIENGNFEECKQKMDRYFSKYSYKTDYASNVCIQKLAAYKNDASICLRIPTEDLSILFNHKPYGPKDCVSYVERYNK